MYRNTYINIFIGIALALIILISAFMIYIYRPMSTAGQPLSKTFEAPSYMMRVSEEVYRETSILLIYLDATRIKYREVTLVPVEIKVKYVDGSISTFGSGYFVSNRVDVKPGEKILLCAVNIHPGKVDIIEIYFKSISYIDYLGKRISLDVHKLSWNIDRYIEGGRTYLIELTLTNDVLAASS